MLGVLVAASPHREPEIASAVRPSTTVALAALGVAVLLALGIWEITGYLITMVEHEGAHAAAMLLVGGTVKSITVNEQLGGETRRGDYEDITVIPWVAGYSGPPLFGLLGAALLVHGSATAVLWVYLFLQGLLLVALRNVFGFLIALGLGALLYLTVTYGSSAAQTIVACTWVWILLVGGVVHAFEQFARPGTDHRMLQTHTKVVPWFVWPVSPFSWRSGASCSVGHGCSATRRRELWSFLGERLVARRGRRSSPPARRSRSRPAAAPRAISWSGGQAVRCGPRAGAWPVPGGGRGRPAR